MNEHCKWENGLLIYKNVNLELTMENIMDYKFQTGMDPIDLIEHIYKNSIQVVRDKKIDQILNG